MDQATAQALPCVIMSDLWRGFFFFTQTRFVLVPFACRVSPHIVHEPVEDLHVAVDRDVHLLPPLLVHGQILCKVTHLFDQKIPGTREVLLQVFCLVTHVDHHVWTAGKMSERYFHTTGLNYTSKRRNICPLTHSVDRVFFKSPACKQFVQMLLPSLQECLVGPTTATKHPLELRSLWTGMVSHKRMTKRSLTWMRLVDLLFFILHFCAAEAQNSAPWKADTSMLISSFYVLFSILHKHLGIYLKPLSAGIPGKAVGGITKSSLEAVVCKS